MFDMLQGILSASDQDLLKQATGMAAKSSPGTDTLQANLRGELDKIMGGQLRNPQMTAPAPAINPPAAALNDLGSILMPAQNRPPAPNVLPGGGGGGVLLPKAEPSPGSMGGYPSSVGAAVQPDPAAEARKRAAMKAMGQLAGAGQGGQSRAPAAVNPTVSRGGHQVGGSQQAALMQAILNRAAPQPKPSLGALLAGRR